MKTIEEVHKELARLEKFSDAQRAPLLAQLESLEAEAAKLEAERQAEETAERHAQASEAARLLLEASASFDTAMAAAVEALRVRRQMGREIRRVCPEALANVGNRLEHKITVNGPLRKHGLEVFADVMRHGSVETLLAIDTRLVGLLVATKDMPS